MGPFDGGWRQIVHLFKYDRRSTLARPLADLMRTCGENLLADADCVVPVPLHAMRRRSRGFNQATELAARLGPPVVGALRRTRATPPQMALPAVDRAANVRGAFAPARRLGRRRRATVAGARVVLVDDVATTGATLEACARVLRQLGANDVRTLTLARVARRRS